METIFINDDPNIPHVAPPELENPLLELELEYLRVSKSPVTPFEETTITWKVKNHKSGIKYRLAGRVFYGGSGSFDVRLGATTTYALTAFQGPFTATLGRVTITVEGLAACTDMAFPEPIVKQNLLMSYWPLLDGVQTLNDGIYIKRVMDMSGQQQYVIVTSAQIAAGDYDACLKVYPMDQFDIKVAPEGILFSGRYNLASNVHPKITFDFTITGNMVLRTYPDYKTKTTTAEFVFLNHETKVDIPWYTRVWLILLGGGLLGVVLHTVEELVNDLIKSGFQLNIEQLMSGFGPARFPGLTTTISQNIRYEAGRMTITQCPFP